MNWMIYKLALGKSSERFKASTLRASFLSFSRAKIIPGKYLGVLTALFLLFSFGTPLEATNGEIPDSPPTISAGGDYMLDFSAGDPELYPRLFTSQISPPSGRASNPIAGADQATTVESLAPENMALGQIVPFIIEIKTDAGGACSDDCITIEAGWETETTNGGAFGYDPTVGSNGIYAAFVDGGDASAVEIDTDATVTSFSGALVGSEIQGTFEICGIDPGETVILEIWLVLQSTIPPGIGGNVQSRLIDATTSGTCETGETISTGNQTVPLLRAREFFTSDVDISVTKSDSQDPVVQGDQLTYTLVVNNAGPSVANDVVLTDILDANTTFVSATITDTEGYIVNEAADCTISGSTFTCDLQFLNPGETITITITVDVSATAPTGNGGGTDCAPGTTYDLTNNVSVTTISDDTDSSNDSDCEPTDVDPACDIAITSVDTDDETCVDEGDGSITINATCTTCTSIEYSINGVDYFPSNVFNSLDDGAYTVYARDSGDPSCNATDNATINEGAPKDDAGFTYPATACINDDTDPVATVTGLAGGTFSVDGGATIDPTTGALDLSTVTANTTYTITYLTNGPCPESSTQTIDIKPADDASFTYPAMVCINADTDPSATVTGLAGGAFSVDGGATIDPTTGALDLSTVTANTTYTITYLTAGDCPESSTQTIDIKPADDASFTYPAMVCINADTDPSATVTGLAGGAFSVDGGATIDPTTGALDLSTVTANTTYTITYLTAGDCPESSTQTIDIKPADDASFTYPAMVCINADTDPSATVTGLAGGAFSVDGGATIDPTTGALDLSTVTANTTYTITYLTAGDCPESSTQTIDIKPADDASFTYPAMVCINSDTDPSATVTGLAGGAFSVDGGATIDPTTGALDLSTVTANTTYTITYLTAGDCPESSTQTIDIKPADDASFTYPAMVCINSDTDPSATVTGLAGGAFSVDGGATIDPTTGALDLSTVTANTTYTITYLTAGDCPESSTQTIDIKPADDASFTYPAMVCINSDTDPSATVTGLAGGAFSVDGGATIDPTTGALDLSTVTANTTYTITYLTAGDCPESSTQTIDIKPADDASFTYPAMVCINSDTDPSATVTGLAGGAFSVDGGATIDPTTGALDLSTVTANTTYTITYLTAGDCPESSTQTIDIKPADDASFTYPAMVCINDDTDPSATVTGLAGGAFSVDGGATIDPTTGALDLSTVTANTTYTITYLTAGDCPESSTQTIDIKPADDPGFTYPATACIVGSNPTATITGLAGGTFSVDNGASIDPATGELDLSSTTAGQMYTITYLTAGDCPESSTQPITIQSAGDASFTYPMMACINADTNPSATITGDAGGTFSVSGGATIDPTTGELDLSTVSANTTYTITYQTAGNCSTSTTQQIEIKPADDASFTYPAMVCINADTDPSATVTGLAGGAFSVDGGATIDPTTGALDLSTVTANTTYTITYLTAGDCPESSTQTIDIKPADDASFTYPAMVCINADTDPSATVTGLAGGAFSVDGGATIDPTTGALDLSTVTANTTYTITYLTAGDCPESSTQTIDIKPADDASFTYPAMVCINSDTDPSATVTGLAGGAFSVDGGATIDPTTGALDLSTVTANTTYTITYLTAGDCPESSTQTIDIKPADDASFTYPAMVCINDDTDPSATVTGLAGGAFSVDGGATIDPTTGALDLSTVTANTTYTITYLTAGDCPESSTQTIDIKPADDPGFTYPATACIVGSNPTATITGLAGGTFSVDNGASIDPATGELDLSSTTAGQMYTITYLTAGDCPESSTQPITIQSAGDASFTYPMMACINADTNPSATITGDAGGTFSVSGGATIDPTTGELDLSTVSANTTYTITYQTAGNCSTSTTQQIEIKPADDASFTYPAMVCINADTDPSATVTGLAGGAFSVDGGATIDPTTGALDLSTVTANTTYTITYLTAGDCPESSTQTIDIKPADDASFTYPAMVCINADTDPSATVTGLAGGAFSVDGGATIDPTTGALDLSTVTANTTYTITYLTAGDCPESSTQTIDIKPADDASFTYPAMVCINSDTDPSATVTGLAGGAFSVDGGATIDPTTGALDLSTVTANTTYTITYLTAGDCPESSTQTIDIKPADDASFTYPAMVCINDDTDPSATVTGLAGGAFSVDGGATIDPTTGALDLSTVTANTTYTITYLTAGDCPESSTQTIDIKPADDPGFTYPATACIVGSNPTATITGLAGGTFSVDNGASIDPATGELDLSSTTAGQMYTITYLTAGDCPESSTQPITIQSAGDASFTYPMMACINADTNPSATITGDAGGTFSVSGGATIDPTTGELDLSTVSANTTYTITYQTAGNCSTSTTQQIEIKPADDASFTYPAMVCINADTDPSATVTGLAGGAFSVDGGATIDPTTGALDLSTVTANTTYTITYLTAGDCPESSTQTIDIKPADDASFTYPAMVCINADTDPSATVTGLAGGAFSVDGGATIDPTTGALDLSTVTANTTYTITYLTAGDCPESSTQTIDIKPADDASFTYPAMVCINADTDPSATVTGLAGGAFSVDGGATIDPTTGALDLSTVTANTTYTITYLTAGDCPESSTQTIDIKPADDASFTYPAMVCINADTDPSATVTGLAGGAFSVDGGATIDPTTGALDLSTVTANTTYTITYLTAGDCPESSTQTIDIKPADDPGFTYPATACIVGSNPTATITGLAGGTFSVDNGASIDPATGELDLSSTTAGQMYTITYLTAGDCPESSTQPITIQSAGDASFTYPMMACINADTNPSATITGDAGGTFSVSGGATIDPTTGELDLSTVSANTTYTITYQTAGNCSTSTTQQIEIKPAPVVNITGDNEYCEGSGGVLLDAGAGFSSYSWSPGGETTQTITATDGSYTVTVTDANGCSGTSPSFVVTENPTNTTNVAATTCDPSQVGVSQQVFANQFGCDSVVITTTTLLPSDTTNVAATTCDPGQVGVSDIVLTNQFGCDSVVITTTTLLPSDTTNVAATTCDPGQVGVSDIVLTNQFGCDSVVITTTTLLPSDTTNVAATTCDPQEAGVTQQTFTNQFGCDSVVIITTVLQVDEIVCDATNHSDDNGPIVSALNHAFWLENFPAAPGMQQNDRFIWAPNTGQFIEDVATGTATITGQIINKSDPNVIFDVNVLLVNKMDWATWSSLGRLYKHDNILNPVGNEYLNWYFFELDPASTLTGAPGSTYDGDVLTLTHRPADMTYGPQLGIGANDIDDSYGFATWFFWSGTLAGRTYTHEAGDINIDLDCEPSPCEDDEVVLAARALLEGPYNEAAGMMNDDLRSMLPLFEPYTGLGFTHVGPGGGENIDNAVLSVTGSNAIVDWVFIELRDAINNTQVVATRSALLQRDGDIVDLDGFSKLSFNGVSAGNYYIVIRHRNHLGMMSLNAISLSEVSTTVDFSDGSTNTWGTQAQNDLGASGKKGMVCANANGDGVIDALDRGIFWNFRSTSGYDLHDANCDGVTDALDRGAGWNNRSRSEQVPY
ncbi:MAG: hypothetical protein R8P61_11080 [Bacteroidia bacterium]|nr:hypothetical protein [Bacteroidia bacterium]